jgi:hypothetical protein
MAKDNTLGAPTEGLGQTVTFGVKADSRVPTLDAPSRGTSRGGVHGSPVTGGVQQAPHLVEQPRDPTFGLLMKMAGAALKPHIEKARTEAFVTGMQRAASGEAVKDIAEGEPWYASVFGDSDVVEGARAYSAQATAAAAAGAIEDSMADVRKLTPEQATGYYNELVSKHLTGDAATDQAVLQGFARTLPATMRRQAKEHYAYRQEEASKAESAAFLSASDLLQKRAATTGPQMQTDEEYAAEAVKLIAGMRPPVGRDIESWTKARTNDILSLAQAGKFHAVTAVRNSGMFGMLPPEARTKIESALDQAENRTITSKLFEYAPELARVAAEAEVFSTDLDPERTTAELRSLNERFKKETGIDRDLLSLDKSSGIIKDARVTILREGERRIREAETEAAKATDAAGKKAIEEGGALQAIALGQAGPAARSLPDGVVHGMFRKSWVAAGAAGGPGAQAQMMFLNFTGAGTGDGYVNPQVKDAYERRVELSIGATMPAEFLNLHAEYRALKAQHPALADAYFGKHADRMARFDELLTDGKPGERGEELAFAQALSQEAPRKRQLSDKQRGQMTKTLESQHDAADWKILSQQREPLRGDQSTQAVAGIENFIEGVMTRPGVSSEEGVRLALERAKRERGDDLLGGFYVRGPGPGAQPLSNMLKTFRPGDPAKGTGDDALDVWDKAFKGVVQHRMRTAGADIDSPVTISRAPDRNGTAWMTLSFVGPNGRYVHQRLSSNDIKNFARDPSGRTAGGQVQ